MVRRFGFPKPKMAKKWQAANRLTRFVYSNTQIFVYSWLFVSIFANIKVDKAFNIKIFNKLTP
jgi:hypothetical protein